MNQNFSDCEENDEASVGSLNKLVLINLKELMQIYIEMYLDKIDFKL